MICEWNIEEKTTKQRTNKKTPRLLAFLRVVPPYTSSDML